MIKFQINYSEVAIDDSKKLAVRIKTDKAESFENLYHIL
jgi:hypothetical protein